MSEELNPADNGTPAVETPASGLPSDNVAADYSGFDLNDDVKSKFKDGKLNGRFGSINEVLEKLKEAEDFKANTIRDQKSSEGSQQQEQQKQLDDAAVQAKQTETVMSMIPSFIENGMVLTPEMERQAVESGIDIRDLKLGAIEVRDRTGAAHAITGGKENYDAMIAWGRESMTPEQQQSFDADLKGGMGEYAIKGLYSDFNEASSKGEVGRIEGSTVFTGVQPYANRRELYKDKDYIESSAGRRDASAIKMYKARLNKTSNDVIFGRQ